MGMAYSFDHTTSDLHPRDLTVAANALGDVSSPLIQLFGGWNGNPFFNQTPEVYDWANKYADTTLASQLAQGATTIALTSSADIEDGTHLLIDNEEIVVTSGTTITRGYGGTSDALHSAAAVVRILGVPGVEKHTWGEGASRTPANYTQYTQIFDRDVMISNSDRAAKHIALPAGETDYGAFLVRMELEETMKLFERAVLMSTAHASTPGGTSSVARTMKGIRQLISSQSCTGALSMTTHIQPALKWLAKNGANPDLIVCSLEQAIALENMMMPYKTANSMTATELNTRITTIQSVLTGRPMAILPHNDMPAGEIMILTKGDCAFRPMGDQTLQFRPAPQGIGTYSGGIVTGEYAVTVTARSYHHIRLYGLS